MRGLAEKAEALELLMAELSGAPRLDCTAAEWARRIGTNERAVSMYVRSVSGKSFARWRLALVVGRAKTMLRSGAQVRAVAAELGYGRPEAFSKAFHACTGEWPSQWQSRGQPGWRLGLNPPTRNG
jgi:AraC-like DNA-binding protein